MNTLARWGFLGCFKHYEEEFKSNLNNLFDIARAITLQNIKLEEHRVILLRQAGVD